MLDRLTDIQLAIFAVVTVICVGVISIFYLHLPAAVGLGAYQVTADFKAGGGLYQNANVTYRGVTIGRVESVGLTNDGVVADMRLNSGTAVPDNVTATVKSVSAVGEQYIDLVPPDACRRSHAAQRISHRPGQHRDRPGHRDLLHQRETLVNSVGDSRLQELLRETFKAFNGSGPELARLIQSSRLLVDEANANYPQIIAADRSGGSVPGRADPHRRRHQVAVRRAGAVHLRGAPGRSAAAVGADSRAGRGGPGQHRVLGHPPDVPGAGGQPGQPRPDRRHLPQVDRAAAGGLARRCSPRSSRRPAGNPRTRAPSWTSRSTSTRRRARPASFRRR